MKIILRVLLVLVLSPLLSRAEELTAAKQQAIRDLMAVSGGTKLTTMISDNVVRSMLEMFEKQDSTLNAETRELLTKEIKSFLQEELGDSGSYWTVVCPIYHKYFTLDEIRQVLAFYQTPVGQKTLTVLPVMMPEILTAAKEWATSLRAPIVERLRVRLAPGSPSEPAK